MDKKNISLRKKLSLIFLGLCLCTALLEVGLRIGGFIYLSLQEYQNKVSLKQKGTYRIICLGESTTVFPLDMQGEDSYPAQLEKVLNEKDTGIRFSVINKGVPGTDTNAIVSLLEHNLDKYNPDMVVTMIGINDQANTVAYGNFTDKNPASCISSSRTYKLLQLLSLHITNKIQEIKLFRTDDNRKDIISSTSGELIQHSDYKEQENTPVKRIGNERDESETYLELGLRYREKRQHEKAEEMFKKAIEINPKNEKAYVGLILCYRNQGKHDRVVGVLTKAIEITPNNYEAFIELGRIYWEQEQFDKAVKILKQATKINPENEEAYIRLGWCYREKRQHENAEEMFKKAIEINPASQESYVGLGVCYNDQDMYEKAKEASKKATEVAGKEVQIYIDFGENYRFQHKFDKSEEMLKKAIEINPKDVRSYIELSRTYRDQGRFDKAQQVLTKAEAVNIADDEVYGGLAQCYLELGENKLAEEYFGKADALRSNCYNQITWNNYRKLKEIVTRRKIKLVCVQYPMRSVESLKKMLEPCDEVVFVDNEDSFKKAVELEGYDQYFGDMFASDFGHCNPKGNRLLAENIADVILKQCLQ